MSHATSPDRLLPSTTTLHHRLRDTLTAVALFVASAAFTLWQNTRVAVLFDLSYLLDSSYRISLGQRPYRDFPFAHAPLPFLLHAAIIHLFGRVYFPHILCAAVEAGLATILTWRLLLNFLKDKEAAKNEDQAARDERSGSKQDEAVREKEVVILAQPESRYLPLQPASDSPWLFATLLAAPLTILGIYAIYPHPIYDSDCILAVLLALFLLQRAAESPIRNASAGAACILPLFTKQNIGLPFLAVTLLTVAAVAALRRLNRTPITPQLALFAGAGATFAAAVLILHATVGLHNYLYWTITFAAQRRLPGLSLMLETYRQTSLLWTIPTSIAGLFLLHPRPAATPSIADSFRATSSKRYRLIAYFLLALPFLWTIAAVAFTSDPDDRADQLLALWPHLLLLAAALTFYNLRPCNLRTNPNLTPFLPLILLATIHGTFLSQQLWGSTYALWPLLMLLIAAMLTQIPTLARPLATTIALTFLLCGGLYSVSLERLNYIHLDGTAAHSTLPQLRGLTTPGPWIPAFEGLLRFINNEIPANDGILLLPGEDPFYFATGRAPRFPVLLFAPATDPYTPQQILDQARIHNIRWLIVKRNLQLTESPESTLPADLALLQHDFTPYRTLSDYDIYRHK